MADANETNVEADVELRGCAYCGEQILPGSYKCPACGGNVGLAWGTAHKEHFLFLFASILVLVGCLASWSQRFPAGAMISKTVTVEAPAVPGAPPPRPGAPKPTIEQTIQVAPQVDTISGLSTIRGSFMFAIAIYGIFVALFNLLYKRMIVWPFFLNAVVALEVGLQGISRAKDSVAWELWAEKTKDINWVEKAIGAWRAIPSAFLLLTFAGAIVLISIVKGVVGGFASASAKQKDKQAAAAEAAEARRKAREGKKGGGDSTEPTAS